MPPVAVLPNPSSLRRRGALCLLVLGLAAPATAGAQDGFAPDPAPGAGSGAAQPDPAPAARGGTAVAPPVATAAPQVVAPVPPAATAAPAAKTEPRTKARAAKPRPHRATPVVATVTVAAAPAHATGQASMPADLPDQVPAALALLVLAAASLGLALAAVRRPTLT